jgi:hypothetical protein
MKVLVYLLKLRASFTSSITLVLAPKHESVNKRLRLLRCNMAQRCNELIERRVHARPTYVLYLRLWIEGGSNALVNLLLRLGNKLNVCERRTESTGSLLTDVNKTCRAYSPTVFVSSL